MKQSPLVVDAVLTEVKNAINAQSTTLAAELNCAGDGIIVSMLDNPFTVLQLKNEDFK